MNTQIIVATGVIMGSGVINAIIKNKPVTPVVIGGYVFMLLLSILDLFGGDMSKLASALAMLAMLYVLIYEFPWQQILTAVRGTQPNTKG